MEAAAALLSRLGHCVDEVQAVSDVQDSCLDAFRDQKRWRGAPNVILVEGSESIRMLCRSDFSVGTLLLQPAVLEELLPCLESRARRGASGPSLALLGDAELLEAVSGIHLAETGRLAFALTERLPPPPALASFVPAAAEARLPLRVLAIDGLTDAANVGAVVRIAAAFGASAVLCSADCCDPFHSKAIRASQGYCFQVPVLRCDLPRELVDLRAHGVMTAAAVVQDGARFLDEVHELPLRWALIVGSEHFGVSQAVRDISDLLLKVRMAEGVDSLNVVVSAGVLLHGCAERERPNAKEVPVAAAAVAA